jgi:hypothetical protein
LGCCLRFPFEFVVDALAEMGELSFNEEERTGETARLRGPVDDDTSCEDGSWGLVARERLAGPALNPCPWTGCDAELVREWLGREGVPERDGGRLCGLSPFKLDV